MRVEARYSGIEPSMKPVELSKHAERRLQWLDLTEDEVKAVFFAPGYVTPHGEGESRAYDAYSSSDMRTLRVAVREEAQRVLVTTVTAFGPRRSKP